MDARDPYTADIKRLNYEALVLFRETVRRDEADACFRLGLVNSTADAVGNATLEELRKIANTGVLLFAARFGETRHWEDVLEAVHEGGESDVNVIQLQAALFATKSGE